MTAPRLTVCIPTHDGRASFLREALGSILSQMGDTPLGSVTVSISDNASQDETQQLVSELSAAHPGLISYHRNETNLGFARNMLRAMAGAGGDYCWLFSSDDRMAPGGLRRALETLACHPGTAGMSVNFSSWDCRMEQQKTSYPSALLPDDPDAEHAYTSLDAAFQQCGMVIGYTSGIVVRRDLWNQTAAEAGEPFLMKIGYFPYAYLIGRMLQIHPLWIWLPDKLAQNRLDNDSLTQDLHKNLLHYYLHVLQDMAHIWAIFAGRNSSVYRALLENSYPHFWTWRQIASYKAHTRSSLTDDARMLVSFTRHLWFVPAFWPLTFLALLIPHPVYRAAYRYGLPLLRSARTARQGMAQGA